MQKRHFEAIAKAFADRSYDHCDDYQACREGIAKELANYFATVNPRFDRARFLIACKVEA
jgi:hypothetical protein